MKSQIGAIVVLSATASLLSPRPLSCVDEVAFTEREIISVVIGLSGYALVGLGVLESSPPRRRNAAIAVGLLLLPAMLLCGAGAELINLGWTGSRTSGSFGPLGIAMTFTVAGVVYAVGSWIQRRRA